MPSQEFALGVNLCERLAPLTDRQRRLRAGQLAFDIVAETPAELVVLDHVEILFDPPLEVDALKCLQAMARGRTLVVIWPGRVERSSTGARWLTWATPDHPDYRRYATDGLIIIADPV